MMKHIATVLLAGLALAVAPALARPVEVTRFHLGEPIARGDVTVEPTVAGEAGSLSFQAIARPVARELARAGYPTAAVPERSMFIASVEVVREERPATVRRSPISIGIGGGSFGRSGGVGVGGSFGIGGGSRGTLVTRLNVRIKRRADATVVWEGRAVNEERLGGRAGDSGRIADRLASALFRGFPGESGRTISAR